MQCLTGCNDPPAGIMKARANDDTLEVRCGFELQCFSVEVTVDLESSSRGSWNDRFGPVPTKMVSLLEASGLRARTKAHSADRHVASVVSICHGLPETNRSLTRL